LSFLLLKGLNIYNYWFACFTGFTDVFYNHDAQITFSIPYVITMSLISVSMFLSIAFICHKKRDINY